MMARLVASIDLIRPTVRRVTRMLATPASTNINATPEITAVLIWSVKLSRSLISLPTSRRSPLGNVPSIARSSGRFVALGNGSGARNSIHPRLRGRRWPYLEVAGERGRGRIGQDVDVVCKTACRRCVPGSRRSAHRAPTARRRLSGSNTRSRLRDPIGCAHRRRWTGRRS